jgi:hypothetical protein
MRWELFMTDENTVGIGASEALLMAQNVRKQVHTTQLLKPSYYNNLAVQTLSDCYNSMTRHITGAENEVIAIDSQSTPAAPPTAAYKQQIKQGQTLFAAPENANNKPVDESSSSSPKDYRR